ncbi:origin recognition complex subunit 6 isoform X2 [Lampris incognitus]|nr:origin recognition complex subunit 6 isoform X2 [Lampris incognitus]XP_056134220.1 origin recognition complex subunit 6 isoform X2 [Lampris incognitus]
MCLELAATSMKLPLDKEYIIKLSGMKRKQYQSNLKTMECLLGLECQPGLRELAVQYGCTDATQLAAQILERYGKSLPVAQKQDLGLSKPLFTTAALISACKCLNIRVDKKLSVLSGAKKAIFERLCAQLQMLGQIIYKENTSLAAQLKTIHKRQKQETECDEEADEEENFPSSPKKEKGEEKIIAQDYEEWKRKILEKALKSENACTC